MERDGVLRLEGIYRSGYGIVPKFVMHDRDLSLESKTIYAYLCAMAGSGEQTFPYRDTILRHLRMSKNTYYHHYNPLIDHGYITVRRPPDKTAANIYTLVSNPKKLEDKRGGIQGGRCMLRYRGLKAFGYGSIPRTVMLDERLTVKAKGLYAYLCSYCGAGDCAFPKRDDIIFHLGVSEPTYYKCYSQLLEYGYLIAVQRMDGTRFGVNDYYLNEDPFSPGSPHAKICDIKKEPLGPKEKHNSSPYPNFRDTKIRDSISGDTKNCDVYSNNSNSKNNSSNNSPSEKRAMTLDGLAKRTMEKLADSTLWIKDMHIPQRDRLLAEFLAHFQDGARGKRIRNIPAYLEVSMGNWLVGYEVRRDMEQAAAPHSRLAAASYNLADLEKMIEVGCLPVP